MATVADILEGLPRDEAGLEVELARLQLDESTELEVVAAWDVRRAEEELRAHQQKLDQNARDSALKARDQQQGKIRLAPDAFATMTAEEFDAADTEIPWVVEKLIAQGEPTLMVAQSEGGKSSAVISMALSVATGQPVWGRFNVAKPGPVVHMDWEQGKSLRRTYREFGKGLGVDVAQLIRDGMLRLATLPRAQLLDPLATDAYMREVSSLLIKLCTGASLCVVNSLTASTNQVNENDAKIARVFNMLTWVSEQTGCAFFVIHHSGRGDNIRARGSSAIDGAVQSIFCCEKPAQPDTDLESDVLEGHTQWWQDKDRIGTGRLKEFRMNWRRVKSEGTQTLTAEDPSKQADGGASNREERPIDRVCLAILRELDKGTSVRATIDELLIEGTQIKKMAWAWLMNRRLVTSPKRGRYLVAPGVDVPAQSHEPIRLNGAPVERLRPDEESQLKPASKTSEYRRQLRGGRVA